MHILQLGKSICLYNKHEARSKRNEVAGGNILPHQGYYGPLVFPHYSKDHSGSSACGVVTDFLPHLFDSGKYTPNDTGFLHQIVYEWLHNPCDTGSFVT